MKRSLIIIVALLASLCSFAQQGVINYIDFEPDLSRTFWTSTATPVFMDLDEDGRNEWSYFPELIWGQQFALKLKENRTEFPFESDRFQTTRVNSNYPSSFPRYGDTLPNCIWDEVSVYPQYYYFDNTNPIDFEYPRHYMGVRQRVGDDDWCYGWIESYVFIHTWFDEETILNSIDLVVLRAAYCTIPNYPLCIGQTSFDWGVEDNEASFFASVHPNPTNGLVTITGQNLEAAEVFNALGQCVAAATGEGEGLTVDLNGLPAGVYFVNVTDKDGRKCVRKVVKE